MIFDKIANLIGRNANSPIIGLHSYPNLYADLTNLRKKIK